MRISIYSPYLDTLGGGERYMMTIAEAFSAGNICDVLLDQKLFSVGAEDLKGKLSKRFNLNLDKVNFIKAPVGKGSSAIERLFFLKKYNLLFYLTDGSIFFPTAQKNILHIQSPLAGQPSKNIWGKVKLKGWDLIIFNSKFTAENSKDKWPLKYKIIYPPVDIESIKVLPKKKIILSVGRFFGYLKDKKQEVLIKTFRHLVEERQIKGWSLYMVGSAGEGDQNYIDYLKKIAEGLSVIFYPNLEYSKLIKLYGEASIYWHAAGFEETDPTKMEHFGISIVEAMAGGCVPVVINLGGLKEIVTKGDDGFLWNDLEELKKLTINLVNNEKLLNQVSEEAVKSANRFNKKTFVENILQLAE